MTLTEWLTGWFADLKAQGRGVARDDLVRLRGWAAVYDETGDERYRDVFEYELKEAPTYPVVYRSVNSSMSLEELRLTPLRHTEATDS